MKWQYQVEVVWIPAYNFLCYNYNNLFSNGVRSSNSNNDEENGDLPHSQEIYAYELYAGARKEVSVGSKRWLTNPPNDLSTNSAQY